jgi:hypothetical protein
MADVPPTTERVVGARKLWPLTDNEREAAGMSWDEWKRSRQGIEAVLTHRFPDFGGLVTTQQELDAQSGKPCERKVTFKRGGVQMGPIGLNSLLTGNASAKLPTEIAAVRAATSVHLRAQRPPGSTILLNLEQDRAKLLFEAANADDPALEYRFVEDQRVADVALRLCNSIDDQWLGLQIKTAAKRSDNKFKLHITPRGSQSYLQAGVDVMIIGVDHNDHLLAAWFIPATRDATAVLDGMHGIESQMTLTMTGKATGGPYDMFHRAFRVQATSDKSITQVFRDTLVQRLRDAAAQLRTVAELNAQIAGGHSLQQESASVRLLRDAILRVYGSQLDIVPDDRPASVVDAHLRSTAAPSDGIVAPRLQLKSRNGPLQAHWSVGMGKNVYDCDKLDAMTIISVTTKDVMIVPMRKQSDRLTESTLSADQLATTSIGFPTFRKHALPRIFNLDNDDDIRAMVTALQAAASVPPLTDRKVVDDARAIVQARRDARAAKKDANRMKRAKALEAAMREAANS